eukprot:TRINITY_DN7842_c0_g2_i2.p1 TRINITY_DN7842_c0_g2~~TRINITY_DN7842_c0_g2_i2.p1  ORF type:complete len:268 (+),score=34.95 TRINITY_DN7842_c0_g2_i2:58-861(+)
MTQGQGQSSEEAAGPSTSNPPLPAMTAAAAIPISGHPTSPRSKEMPDAQATPRSHAAQMGTFVSMQGGAHPPAFTALQDVPAGSAYAPHGPYADYGAATYAPQTMGMPHPSQQMYMHGAHTPYYVAYSPWTSSNMIAPYPPHTYNGNGNGNGNGNSNGYGYNAANADGSFDPHNAAAYAGYDAYGNPTYVVNAPTANMGPRDRQESTLDQPIWPAVIYLAGCVFGPCFWISGVYWWNAPNPKSRFLGRLNVISFLIALIIIIIVLSS